jgi:hypothetical protein
MKKNIIFIILLLLISIISFAQDTATDTTGVKVKDKPVRAPFESSYLIDAQTTIVPTVKTLEAVIQHKFGTIENGHSDLWGIYAPGSNIRLGLNYVIVKNFQIGAGITKKNMTTDLNLKWNVLKQTRKNTVPVAVALYANVAIDGRNITSFESGKVRVAYTGPNVDFKFPDRLSYFSQLIVGRKFTDWLSVQAAVSFTHYNSVGVLYDHDKIGAHFNGRIKVSPQGSIIFNYDEPLKIKGISEQHEWTDHPKPNLAFGYEVSTGTHVFQIFMGTASGLLPQDNIMWNQNDFTDHQMAIGFTITRLWGF